MLSVLDYIVECFDCNFNNINWHLLVSLAPA